MARNNSSRSGGNSRPEPADAPASSVAQVEDGPPVGSLNFVTPTEFVELPTKGRFYPEGHPLKDQEVVEIKFMTAKEEDMLTSPALLKKGLAIDRVLQNLFVDKRIKIADLYLGDKNAITLASRISGYGPEYNAKVQCPACGQSVRHSFDLSLYEFKPEPDYEALGVVLNDDGTLEFTLPRSKVKVKCRLMTSRDERYLLESGQKRKKHGLGEAGLTDMMKRAISAVNGKSDQSVINNFVENMPAFDSRYFRRVYQQCTPNVQNEQDFECRSCGHEQEMEVPYGVEFFWPE